MKPLAILAVLWLALPLQSAEKPRMNVLLLYADDWRHDSLGCAGNPIVKTPVLDQLAKEGVRFTHNCVTTSICGVSRANLLTGQYMSRHGNPAFQMFKTPWNETLPGILRKEGYWVGHVGKWHCGPFPAKEYDYGKAYGGVHFIKQPNGSLKHVTQKNEDDALDFLTTRPKDKPFFLKVSFFATHAQDSHKDQYLYQESSAKLYADAKIPVPKTMTDDHFKRLPEFLAKEKNEGRNRWHWRFDTPEKYQTYMKAYYRLATEVDTTCGRILNELKKQNLDDNTLVIFTTDNGYFHGEHGLADKWYPYQESIRVPLIVRDPRMPMAKKGTTNDDFTLNIDLAPTMLTACGAPVPKTMQGTDFAPLYLGENKPAWRTEFFYEHAMLKNNDFIPASEALVRKDFKYIYWPDFKFEEFFNLKNDPLEESNAIKNDKYAKTIAEMRKRFAELKDKAK